MNMKKTHDRGFTLIELVVVISILSILAVTMVPLVNSVIEKSRISRMLVDIQTLETSGMTLNGDTGTFPENEETLVFQSDLFVDNDRDGWAGPYISNKNLGSVSPWGGRYLTDNTRDLEAPIDGIVADDWVIIIDGGGVGSDVDLIPIPAASVIQIDERVDGEENLAAGRIQGSGDELEIVLVPDAFVGIEAP
jgi:prepilin-type N-terminal cleavage/methylation domain-containing protein